MCRSFRMFFSETYESRKRMVVEPMISEQLEYASIFHPDRSTLPRPTIVTVVRRPRFEDMPWCRSNVPVMSERLADLITELDPDAIECIPAELRSPRGRRIEAPMAYYLVNIRRVLECYDSERSDVEEEPDGRLRIIPYVLDLAKVPQDAHLFRLRHFEMEIVASSILQDRIERACMVGPEFGEKVNVFGYG